MTQDHFKDSPVSKKVTFENQYASVKKIVFHDAHERRHLAEEKAFMPGRLQLRQHTVQQLKLSRRTVQVGAGAVQHTASYQLEKKTTLDLNSLHTTNARNRT